MSGKLIRLFQQGSMCLALLLASTPLRAELVLSAPPWDTEEKQTAFLEPVAKAMSEWLGTKVVYRHNKNFTTYSLAMRGGKFDLVLDGAQFNAWRIKNMKHEALVTLPEKLSFVVLTSNKAVSSTQDLIEKPVCGQAPPHLGTLLFLSEYRDPARRPILQAVKGEIQVYEDLKSGKCSTAILRNNAYAKMSEPEKAKYKAVFTSRSVPNVGLSAGPNVTEAQRRILVEKMTDTNNLSAFKPLFEMKIKAANNFVKADPKDYEGLDQLLESMSYGW